MFYLVWCQSLLFFFFFFFFFFDFDKLLLESSRHKKKGAREKETRMSPSRAPVLSFAHYVQAPATQANKLNFVIQLL